MKTMPEHIEAKLRQWARKKNLSEVEFVHVKEFLSKLAKIHVRHIKNRQLKKAA